MHSFHLVEVGPATAARAMVRPPTGAKAPGLVHAECLAGMRLGAPVVSPDRLQLTRLVVFAEWADEGALDRFLDAHPVGRQLADGWHVRLDLFRRWGSVDPFAHLPETAGRLDPGEPTVGVTLARLRLPELARFVRVGRPVERQVRDDPGTTLALAAVRPPRTFSTFSVWRSTREMSAMVHGRGTHEGADRHVSAMRERKRRDFHHEFMTMRFRPLAEHGSWQGRTGIVPGLGR